MAESKGLFTMQMEQLTIDVLTEFTTVTGTGTRRGECRRPIRMRLMA